MAVLIEKVVVRNFRSISLAEFSLGIYTPLIGYNNSGKTNAISAIQWLLRRTSLAKSDFTNSDEPVEVEAEVVGIAQEDLDAMPLRQRPQIEPYVVDGRLKIKRTQAVPLARTAEIPLSVWDPRQNAWAPNPTGIDNALAALLPEPIRIGAMEDAAEDASKAKASTTIGKLLAEFVAPVRAAHEVQLSALLYEIERRLSADGDTRFTELSAIEEAISDKIGDLFPGIGARLHFPTPAIDDLIKSGTLRLYEGVDATRDFSSYGHGTQRSVQMALVRHLADVRRGGARMPGTTLLLIDEPELYLHPFAVEQVRVALKTLASNGYQVIFSTHSAQLVPAVDAQHALLMRKIPGSGSHARRRLRDAIQIVVPDSVHQMEQLFTLGNSSQVLFSDRVILTEGKTEQRLVPHLYQAVRRCSLGQDKSALVAQSGVNDTKKSMQILTEMDLPVKAIVDLDYALTGAIRHGFIVEDDPDVVTLLGILQRLANAGQISVTAAGLPTKGVVTAADAFNLLATQTDAQAAINALHNKLLPQGVWLWTNGSIEVSLGLREKNEREWARFQAQLDSSGLHACCADPAMVERMINWIAA